MRKLMLLFSSVFGLGYIRYASGTFTSAAAAVLWYLFAPNDYYAQIPIIVCVFFVSLFLSSIAEDIYQNVDDGRITIDELAGMWVTLAFLPKSIGFAIAGFFLFRFFDIKKPFFINKLQNLRGGLGITADDIAAGVFANIILQAVYYLWLK